MLIQLATELITMKPSPSNNEQLGLWMEAERMRHAVINQIGVDTQRESKRRKKNENG